MFFFQLPRLPEWLLRRNDYALLLQVFEHHAAHAQLSVAQRDACRSAFAQPGALRAMLNWYRAMFLPS